MFDRQRYDTKRVVLSSLRAIVRDLDPALVSTEDAVELVDWFAEVERLGAAGKTLLAGRAGESDAWRRAGDRSPADWLAKRTGTSVGTARSTLETAAKLDDAPATDVALRAGELSPAQAEAIAPAAAVDPSSEPRLLEMAKHQSLQKLIDECARVRAAAEPDPKARHERIRRDRFWRRSTHPDGSRRGSYAGTPEEVALIEAAAQRFIDARLDAARRAGEHETSEAYAFDGLAAMAQSTMTEDPPCAASTTKDVDDEAPAPEAQRARGGRGRKRMSERRELILLCDYAAWVRGLLLPGETCEIPGVGPVPIETALEQFGDALLRIILHNGVDITTVVHTGRTANEVQATAVFARQRGRCGRPPCGLPISEIDHRNDFARYGPASFDDLLGLCGSDHDLKSRHGHTYRREADGSVTWIRPDGTEEHERPPPVDTG
ncbi:MAG: hypothetical protein QOD30_814 [Actinomycetota bacterium]|nr:hypothetical protein [Actinomycetota bacterium]